MKIGDMTTDMIMACALKCPIKLPHDKGAVKVKAGSGDWFAYRAKTELTRRWRKACIEDLRQRELRGGSYPGDVGHCVIGGKKFSLYPKSGMLVRDDFALWAEAHIDEVWDFHLHRQRLPEKPPESETVTVDPQLKMFKDIRQRALKMKDIDDLVEPGLWNTQYDMKKTLSEYALDIKRNERNGRVYISVKMLADLLAAMREACANIAEYAKTAACHTEDAHLIGYLNQIERWAEAALAAPPRNCDIGTAEEQSDRLDAFCLRHKYCSSCPCKYTEKTSCSINWALMPYEEGGAE